MIQVPKEAKVRRNSRQMFYGVLGALLLMTLVVSSLALAARHEPGALAFSSGIQAPAPVEQYHCPDGTLSCITNFCNTVGLYCCPSGYPYLNHCDCLCYQSNDFSGATTENGRDCKSYSYCSR